MSPGAAAARVVVLTGARLPAGLLSLAAWDALRAGPVVVTDGAHPLRPVLEAAGVPVAVEPLPLLLARERVVWAAPPGLLPGQPGHGPGLPGAAVLVGSEDPPGARLLDVVAVMDRLRSAGGCPWDAAQTHRSLMPYLLEEAYEVYEALEDGDATALREELGDLLLQVAFHARIAEDWGIDEVAGDLVDKLVRRHPHVFAGAPADDLEGSWEALKRAEKGRTSVTEGVPLGQPALALAAKLQSRAGRLGAALPTYDGVGGRLWELVRECRAAGLDPEVELRAVARAFRDRLAAVERSVRDEGGDPAALTPEQWRRRWS